MSSLTLAPSPSACMGKHGGACAGWFTPATCLDHRITAQAARVPVGSSPLQDNSPRAALLLRAGTECVFVSARGHHGTVSLAPTREHNKLLCAGVTTGIKFSINCPHSGGCAGSRAFLGQLQVTKRDSRDQIRMHFHKRQCSLCFHMLHLFKLIKAPSQVNSHAALHCWSALIPPAGRVKAQAGEPQSHQTLTII